MIPYSWAMLSVQSCAKVSPYVARKSRAELRERLAYSAFRLFAG